MFFGHPSLAHINPGRIAGIILQFFNRQLNRAIAVTAGGKTFSNRFREWGNAFPVWVLVLYIILVLLVINGIYTLASKKIRDDAIVGAIKDDTV